VGGQPAWLATQVRPPEPARPVDQGSSAVGMGYRFAMAAKDPYELLGVPRDATDERIRAAYELEINRATREGAFRYAAELATAYETISNSRRRALYERHGFTAIRERSPGAAAPPKSWRAAAGEPTRGTRRRSGRWKRLVLTALVIAVIVGLFALSLSSR